MTRQQFFKQAAAVGTAIALAAPLVAFAQLAPLTTEEAGGLGLNTSAQTDLKQVIVNVVKFILTFLGLLAVIIIIYGGFLWMTSRGNDEQVGQAKSTITAGLIGLVIIILAYVITNVVVSTIQGDNFLGTV